MGNKIATIAFWFIVAAFVVAYWSSNLVDLRKESDNPYFWGSAMFVVLAMVLGIRECVRALKGAPVSTNTFSSVIFWTAATLILAVLLYIFFFVA
jgi:hypothetical protein